MDGLTALCLVRELLAYPREDVFDLLESGSLDRALESAGTAAQESDPVAWTQKPTSLEEWQALYLSTFEVGVPSPKCPLQETFYADESSASELIRENFLFYRHFDFPLVDDPAPHDFLPKQLDFLIHLEGLLADPEVGEEQRESVSLAREDFVSRHLRSWVPRLARRASDKGVDAFYVRTLDVLDRLLQPA